MVRQLKVLDPGRRRIGLDVALGCVGPLQCPQHLLCGGQALQILWLGVYGGILPVQRGISAPNQQLSELVLLTVEACLPEYWWRGQHPSLDRLAGQAEA